MKKYFLLIVATVAYAFACNNLQAQTRIGKEHLVAAGIHYGYGGGNLANFAGVNADFSSATNNFRVRVDLDALQRPTKNSSMCLGGSINAQYLFPLAENDADGFYLYPSLGFCVDMTKNAGWKGDFGIGFNAGGGAEYQINDMWAMFVEGAYQVRFMNEHRVAFQIGFSYAF